MKAIMISCKPKWCALMMNGNKTIEVRKNKALYKAIQKLIDEYGFADIYVYCSKDDDLGCIKKIHKDKYVCGREFDINDFNYLSSGYNGKGKVVFKFRCYKVEEIGMWNCSEYGTPTLMENSLCIYSCLNFLELKDYIKDKPAYAIHISDLEIFDKPKELSEFKHYKKFISYDYTYTKKYVDWELRPLTKAPQNMCYVEVKI